MAQDRNGNNHKAAGRPDGGQFDKKAGQGSDDDLDFGGYVAGMDAAVDRTAIKERPETLSADDWRVLRRSASWGVRMLAWSSPKSPTPTDDEFDELLYDESQRVRGAAAYRDDLTEAQVEALLHDGNPNVRRKAVMSRNAARESVERMARLDNNGFVRGTADFRLDPAGHAETGDRTHDAVYGGGRVSDGTDAPAGIALPPGRRWKRIGREGARITLAGDSVADVALVPPSAGMSDYTFRRKYGLSRPGALDPSSPALLVHTVHTDGPRRSEVSAVLPPDAAPSAEALDDVAFAFLSESTGYLESKPGKARAVLTVTADDVEVDVVTPDGYDEDAGAELRGRMLADRADAIDALRGPTHGPWNA